MANPGCSKKQNNNPTEQINRQTEIARLFTHGLTSKKIAKEVGISHRTVEGYLLDIKHNVQDKTNRALNKDQLIQILRNSNIH